MLVNMVPIHLKALRFFKKCLSIINKFLEVSMMLNMACQNVSTASVFNPFKYAFNIPRSNDRTIRSFY